ncbi:hypothetical protein CROQUDRAFT_666298 [Cronartium quercuum f. sp. fusiforme G11]|uniref:Uncharacterized protein n=1 Tax=Cronartium quercuum f. sp. fusiforme G11 TaxID=708437 RepID=A0A9P6N930_9BASI|nr:hypothetical protein CROQUDRAFT_666298 [Cronartium quercuum f. sp. fusiforme G11]
MMKGRTDQKNYAHAVQHLRLLVSRCVNDILEKIVPQLVPHVLHDKLTESVNDHNS